MTLMASCDEAIIGFIAMSVRLCVSVCLSVRSSEPNKARIPRRRLADTPRSLRPTPAIA